MAKIVSVGALNVDQTAYVDNFCKTDGEEAVKELYLASGGQAGNIASGVGRLGEQAYFFGNIGDDAFTHLLLDDFAKDNVNHEHAIRTTEKNNMVFCVVNNDGERILHPFNYSELTKEHFPQELYDADAIIFSSLLQEDIIDVYAHIAQQAKEKGVLVALDPGNVFAKKGLTKLAPLLKHCDYFFPSQDELDMTLKGTPIQELLALTPNVVVTKGEQGAVLYKQGVEPQEFMANFLNDHLTVTDTTGAGDCFTAAFISHLVAGNEESAATNYAMLAAGLSVTRKGARGMPTPQEIQVLKDATNTHRN